MMLNIIPLLLLLSFLCIFLLIISITIHGYIDRILSNEKKIIFAFCVAILPIIISAFTEKIFATYAISIMFIFLYLELKNNYGNYGK